MYYLVIENLGRKKCIEKYEKNIYESGQSWDCLKNIPFVESGKKVVGKIQIRCIADPFGTTEAKIYSDRAAD
jgi:hypothetical protein